MRFPWWIKIIGIEFMALGIAVEIITRADVGMLIWWIGSLVFAIGSNILYFMERKRRRRKR